LGNLDPDPAVTSFTETHIITPNFLSRFNRQSITGRIVFETADENTDNFAVKIQKRSPRFAALCWQVHPLMGGGEIAAEIRAVETGNHSEARSFRKIERISDCNNRIGNYRLFSFTD